METLQERISRLSEFIGSTRYALTESDVIYDYDSGNHRYALDVDRLIARMAPGMIGGRTVWSADQGWSE